MTDTNTRRRRTSRRAVRVVVIVGLVATGLTTAAGHTVPSPDCGDGADGGVVYTADSGFRVVDDSDGQPPDGGPFLDDETVAVGDAELSAGGAATVHLENASRPVCVGAIDTSAAPVEVTVADTTVSVTGDIDTLSVGAVTFDAEDTGGDLAFSATDTWTLTVRDTGLQAGTTVELVATGGDEVLTSGTVDDEGSESFALPAGDRTVTVRAATPTTTTTETETTATGTATATETGTATVTTPGANATTTAAGPNATATPTETESEPTPGFGVFVALAALAAALFARRR